MKIKIRDIHKGTDGAGVPIPLNIRRILEEALGKEVYLEHLMNGISWAVPSEISEISRSENMIMLRIGSYEETGAVHCWRLCFYDEVKDES